MSRWCVSAYVNGDVILYYTKLFNSASNSTTGLLTPLRRLDEFVASYFGVSLAVQGLPPQPRADSWSKCSKRLIKKPMLHIASPVFWGLSPVQGVEKGAFSLLHLDVKFAHNWLLWGTPHEWRPRGIRNPRPPDSIYTNY